MKDQPWDLNQTWPVGRKWMSIYKCPQKIRAGPPDTRLSNRYPVCVGMAKYTVGSVQMRTRQDA